jgi:D-alanine-D-alanine ligase
MKTVVILHHPLLENAGPDDKDVLEEVATVAGALQKLGYHTEIVPFDLNLPRFLPLLKKLDPVCVFNLVESLDGDGGLLHLACSVLDHLDIPYTGARTEAMFLTSNKVLAKRWMRLAGIPTAEWIIPGADPECELVFPARYIVKPQYEDASIGLDETSVKQAGDMQELLEHIRHQSSILQKKCFAERFIAGREFNLAVLGRPEGARVFPPAEIMFDFPEGKDRIVDYRAKWVEDSFEYNATRRTFEIPEGDERFLARLEEIALECWKSFDLRGYARVDFRVDEQGNPFVLEINANPCITPHSGFPASAGQAGIEYHDLIHMIMDDTLRGKT